MQRKMKLLAPNTNTTSSIYRSLNEIIQRDYAHIEFTPLTIAPLEQLDSNRLSNDNNIPDQRQPVRLPVLELNSNDPEEATFRAAIAEQAKPPTPISPSNR
jgi:hypothetical protein